MFGRHHVLARQSQRVRESPQAHENLQTIHLGRVVRPSYQAHEGAAMSESQPIKVLHFSSRYEECGVAKYLTHYSNGMADNPAVVNEYFEVSPYETHHMS